MEQSRRALVVGASGIAGQAIAAALAGGGWEVRGLSRRRPPEATIEWIEGDALQPESLEGIRRYAPQGIFIAAWLRQPTEAENIRVNSAIVRNLLVAAPPETLEHAALLTGLKHYLGPFENYASGASAETPFREESPRLDIPNFYYAQEDELFAAAERGGFGWSVHRAHTIFGFATGNAMNMALTLGALGALCRETDAPMVFPGSETQWNGVTDATDAGLVGAQMAWAVSEPAARNQAFNIANGDTFRGRGLWPRLAERLGCRWEGYEGEPRPLEQAMAGRDAAWRELATREGLIEPDLRRVASWWHTDSDLGRPIECFTDMSKSRKAGFLEYRSSEDSLFDAISRYEQAGILPRP